jgi:hypothetical protein
MNSEYEKYHSSKRMKQERALRNAANRRMSNAGLIRKGDGKAVDHKDGNPNNNSRSNLRVITAKANRKKQ